jgi:hypothetical protein
MLRRAAASLLVCALAFASGGCGGDAGDGPATGPTGSPTAAPEPEQQAEDEEQEQERPPPVGEWTWETLASDDFPRPDGFAYLVDVRASSHEAGAGHPAFDRVVLELEGEEPSWRVAPEDPPIVEDPSGMEVAVDGEAFLRLTLHPASGRDMTGDETVLRYEGPSRIVVGGHVVTELVQVTDHHDALAWVVGLSRRAPFAVALLPDPPRLVVDVVDETG